jgi:hypothetical protein
MQMFRTHLKRIFRTRLKRIFRTRPKRIFRTHHFDDAASSISISDDAIKTEESLNGMIEGI